MWYLLGYWLVSLVVSCAWVKLDPTVQISEKGRKEGSPLLPNEVLGAIVQRAIMWPLALVGYIVMVIIQYLIVMPGAYLNKTMSGHLAGFFLPKKEHTSKEEDIAGGTMVTVK